MSGNRHDDEFAGFRGFMTTIPKDGKNTVTLQDLKDQWDFQRGKCPYTGWDLELPPYHNVPNLAGLDRIDPSRGYEPGNFQFVCIQASNAKGPWSDTRLLEFCNAVSSMVYGKNQVKSKTGLQRSST